MKGIITKLSVSCPDRKGLKAKAIVNLGIILILGAVSFCALPVYATLTDTPTAWTNFTGPDGFIRAYTYKGDVILDEEKGDSTHGPAAVSPTNVNLASGAPKGALGPGTLPTAYHGYYDGGTDWDPNNPSTMDDDYIFFRMRIDADPSGSGGYKSYHWNVVIDIDGDGFKEYWIDLDGNDDNLLILYNNDNTQDVVDPVTSEVNRFEANPATTTYSHTRIVDTLNGLGATGNEYFIELQIPMTAFDDLSGVQQFFPDTPMAFVFSTGASNQNPLQKDWMMDLCWIANEDPICFGDPETPSGTPPIIYFTDIDLEDQVSFYYVGDDIYVVVNDREANTDTGTVQTISVTVTDPMTGDSEDLTLTESGADTGYFSNSGSLPQSRRRSGRRLRHRQQSSTVPH